VTESGERLDVAIVRRGFAETRERAQGLILAGLVEVAGQPVDRSSYRIASDTAIRIRGPEHPFVGRGGLKLAAALDQFSIDPGGKTALDIGASTGGFTDCLLQRGAAKVYAVDVGYGQLAWRLRQDSRVVAIERCNARYLDRTLITDCVHVATIDVSFISLGLILPAVSQILDKAGVVIALLKPQFEIGKGKLGKGGVIRDEHVRRETVDRVRRVLEGQGWLWVDEMTSPIVGQKGNVEYLVRLAQGRELVSNHERSPR
jgi:23S rRNA (cytidine1920-2'-O)/16S rRNA (cytidine1409-2'-O)-methyltransferase